jgi:hypothetical protein
MDVYWMNLDVYLMWIECADFSGRDQFWEAKEGEWGFLETAGMRFYLWDLSFCCWKLWIVFYYDGILAVRVEEPDVLARLLVCRKLGR